MTSNPRLEAIKASAHLPSPKGAALQVLQLCQKDDVTGSDISHAIKADPALSARLVKLANSPMTHQVRPIVSVDDAVKVLGLNTVRQIVLGLSLVDSSRNLKCESFDYQKFWSHSLLRAIAAHNLVALSGPSLIPAEEVFVIGLLADVGSLALASVYPSEYAAALEKKSVLADSSMVAIENAAFGFDHNLLSKEMVADWHFPAVFQSAIMDYEDPTKATVVDGSRNWFILHLLHVAETFASVCLAEEKQRSKMISKLVFRASRLGVELKQLMQFSEKTVNEWHDWSRLFSLRVVDVPTLESMMEVAPLAPEKSDAGSIPKNADLTFKLRILLVDDDRAVLLVMKMLLDNAGHTVAVARNGKEGLAMIKEFKPHIILTDWIMPEMDGVEFCKTLRKNPEWRNIYVFMMTAQESTDRLVEAFDAGANDYMTKPINPKILGARLSAGQRVVQLQEELQHEREQLQRFSNELSISNQRLQQLALTDELTGLHNRRFANEHLERQWAMAERNNTALSCMMLDIDYFKQINDSYGHKTGDEALKQVAKVLQASVRKQDVVCRLGGEEFLVICPEVDGTAFFNSAERLRENIAKLPMHDTSGKSFSLTISLGIASKNTSLTTAEMLLQLADKRLYIAKENGRNRTIAK